MIARFLTLSVESVACFQQVFGIRVTFAFETVTFLQKLLGDLLAVSIQLVSSGHDPLSVFIAIGLQLIACSLQVLRSLLAVRVHFITIGEDLCGWLVALGLQLVPRGDELGSRLVAVGLELVPRGNELFTRFVAFGLELVPRGNDLACRLQALSIHLVRVGDDLGGRIAIVLEVVGVAHNASSTFIAVGLQPVCLVVKIIITVAARLDLVRVVQDAGAVVRETAVSTTVATKARHLEPVSIELAADARPVAIDRLAELSRVGCTSVTGGRGERVRLAIPATLLPLDGASRLDSEGQGNTEFNHIALKGCVYI